MYSSQSVSLHNPNQTIRPCHKAAILPRGTKKALFYHAKPHPHGSIARLSVLKQSSFGLPGQYGRRVTRVNANKILRLKGTTYTSCLESFCAAVLDIYETATMCSP